MASGHSSHQQQPNFVVPPAVSEFAVSRSMEVIQEKNQRILRHNPSQEIAVPPEEHELYIGGLPQNCLEPMLVPILESFGDIYEFRMKLDSNGSNRDHAFVTFYNHKAVNDALVLNNFEILPGHPIEVFKSIKKSCLVLIGVPFNKTAPEIFKELEPMFKGLKSIGVADRQGMPRELRQVVIAVYSKRRSAILAMREMVSRRLYLWNYRVHVDVTRQKTDESPLHFKCTNLLQVRGFPSDTTKDQLLKMFNDPSNDGVIHVLRYKEDEAIIFFRTRENADMAKLAVHKTILNGNEIHVEVFSPTITNKESQVHEGSLGGSEDPQALDNAQPVGDEAGGSVEQRFSLLKF